MAEKTPCPSCQYPNYKPGAPCPHCKFTKMDFCCQMMKDQVRDSTDEEPCRHHTPMRCPDVLVVRVRTVVGLGPAGVSTKYVLPIKDGGENYVQISYCPWCGKKLEGLEAPPPPGFQVVVLRKAFQGSRRSGGKQTKLLRQARQKAKKQTKGARRRLDKALVGED